MIEFLNLAIEVLFWAVVFWLAFRILGAMISQHLENKLKELDAEIAAIKKTYKRVKIEEHHDMFYLFNADTDEFIGQGRTAQEIAELIRGEVVLNVMEGDPDVIKRFRETVPQAEAQ